MSADIIYGWFHSIKMRAAEEMDQADLELRTTIIKVWPYEGKEKIDLLVPPREGADELNEC